jgi:aminoglycoside phosphotransferase family enzyme/predicted kinase
MMNAVAARETPPSQRDPRRNEAGLPALIAAMMRPDFYPEHPPSVELRQTHISWVLLAGDFVYKIKKPLSFSFVDYSTLARRRHFCEEEVRLNRRLSHGVYLGVVPIVTRDGGFAVGDDESHKAGRVAEYAVKMRRLPEYRMLDRLVAEHKADREMIRRLARRLAAFHADAAVEPSRGGPAAVWKMFADNFEEIRRLPEGTIGADELGALERYCRAFIANHWALLGRRAAAGRFREGHGDLRCEHVCFADGGLEIIDCVEFNQRLRYGDVACDLAFLAMDLERLGAPALAHELVSAYAEASGGDDELPTLMPLYKCYRACVRGKVEALKAKEHDVPPGEREKAIALARRYFKLASQYAQHTRPGLIIVCGMSATGKSTLASRLAGQTGFAVLNSDVIRKTLAGIAPTTSARTDWNEGVYDDRSTQRTYSEMLARARTELRAGRGVIADATFRDPHHRRMFVELAGEAAVPILFVECRAGETEVMRRLADRDRKRGSVSDATPAIYIRQRETFAPLTEVGDQAHLVVDERTRPEQVAMEVEAVLASC